MIGQPPAIPQEFVIGFNLVIDRLATMKLMSAVGVALDHQASRITICLTSPGGSPEQAFYAYELLAKIQTPLTMVNVGNVQSAAMTLFLAADTRIATPDSHFMMHRTVHTPSGGSQSLDHLAFVQSSVQSDDARAMNIVAARTGKSPSVVDSWFQGEILRNAAFAQANGIATAIAPFSMPANARFFQVVV